MTPGVVKLLTSFEEADMVYIVFEACMHGDLYQLMTRHKKELTEDFIAAKIVLPLLITLDHLHRLHIVHRDLKPENIFLSNSGEVLLGDFGLAAHLQHDSLTKRVVSLPSSSDRSSSHRHSKPKCQPYNEKIDVWGVGVLVYEMLVGVPPFEVEDPKATAQLIMNAPVGGFPATMSVRCRDFIESALEKQGSARPSIAELLQHPWLQRHIAREAQTPSRFPELAVTALRQIIDKTWIDSRLETLLDSTDNVAANSALAQTSQEFVASAIISVQTTATKLPKLSPTSTPFSTLDEHSCHSAVDENKQSDFDPTNATQGAAPRTVVPTHSKPDAPPSSPPASTSSKCPTGNNENNKPDEEEGHGRQPMKSYSVPLSLPSSMSHLILEHNLCISSKAGSSPCTDLSRVDSGWVHDEEEEEEASMLDSICRSFSSPTNSTVDLAEMPQLCLHTHLASCSVATPLVTHEDPALTSIEAADAPWTASRLSIPTLPGQSTSGGCQLLDTYPFLNKLFSLSCGLTSGGSSSFLDEASPQRPQLRAFHSYSHPHDNSPALPPLVVNGVAAPIGSAGLTCADQLSQGQDVNTQPLILKVWQQPTTTATRKTPSRSRFAN
eukprot:gene14084-20036_t